MRRGRPRKDGGGDQTDLHIIMQLRKTILLNGQNDIYFRNGDIKKVIPRDADMILEYYANLKNEEKFVYQDKISYSFDDFQSGLMKIAA